MRIVLAMEAREGHFKTKVSVSRRQLATSFEDMMSNYHPSGVAEDVAETSSNTQSAFRRLWKKYGVKRHQHDLSRGCVSPGQFCDYCHLEYDPQLGL